MMKRKLILFSILLTLFAISSNAQIEVEQEVTDETESTTQGFFVKGGSQKIEALECYTFKDLILSFDLKEEHFTCDGIDIEILVGTREWKVGSIAMSQKEFTALFGGKKYAYFKVFSSEDMKEISQWGFNRSLLQHTAKKRNLDGSKMVVKVSCGKITGEEEISEVVSDKVVTRKKKIWKWDEFTTFSIELKNRIYINPAKFFISDYPKKPVATGNCYE